jgi:hypothetical protein
VSSLSREEAIDRIRSPLRELRFGKLRAVIAVRIPYDVFELGNESLAIDAVKGTLDLYRINDVLDGLEESRVIERGLTPAQTRSALEKRLKPKTAVKDHVNTILVPYWIGIFERRGAVHIEVLDGIRGTLEGAKMRDLIAEDLRRRREDCE